MARPAQGHGDHPSRPQRVHREIFRDDRATSPRAASASRPSTGAARAAPTGCCATRSAAMSRDFQDYVRDLDQLLRGGRPARLPRTLLRAGAIRPASLIALLAAPVAGQPRPAHGAGRAASSTYTGLPLSMPTISRHCRRALLAGPRSHVLAHGARGRAARRPSPTNKVTTDIGRYRRNIDIYEEHPQAGARRPDRRLDPRRLRAVAQVENPAFMQRIPIPVLFIGAGADEVVSTRAIEAYAQAPARAARC